MKQFIRKVPILRYTFNSAKFVFISLWQLIFGFIYSVERVLRRKGLMGNAHSQISIKNLKNKFRNKRCFIVCTGPSLKVDNLETLRIHEEISFSMNSMINFLGKTKYIPTFYCVQDTKVVNMFKDEMFNHNIPYVFIGLSNSRFQKYVINYKEFIEEDNVVFYRLNVIYRWIQIHFPNCRKQRFKISNECDIEVCDGGTVAYSALQLAKYMGFSKVYLLGADCDYTGSVNHFDGTHYFTHTKTDGDLLIESYVNAKILLEDDSFKIYNATRGGRLEVFERVNFEELF